MKLLRLSFHDHAQGWGFDDLRFNPDVTLLVGASGVGKTRVLNSIRKLREIARDRTFLMKGVSWSVDFLDEKGRKYTWEGKTESHSMEFDSVLEWLNSSSGNVGDLLNGISDKVKPLFVQESLTTEQQAIFSRNGETFEINGKRLEAKLSNLKSAFALLGEENSLQSAKKNIERILVSDDLDGEAGKLGSSLRVSRNLLQTLGDIEAIREHEIPTVVKFVASSQTAQASFDQITNSFQDIFPTIEKVWVGDFKSDEIYLEHAIHFKEKGVDQSFTLASLSSGMKRTLFHLARLALWPDGTVILIDEFENSLGANCINVVADALMRVGDRLQFVISSHHPYIINKIPVDHWKIVARDKGQVQFFSAEQLKIGRSKHKAFTELINNKIFQNGHIPT